MMLITPIDLKTLKTDRARKAQNLYFQTFNERLTFNYQDFKRNGNKCAAEMYVDALETAIKQGALYKSKYTPENEVV